MTRWSILTLAALLLCATPAGADTDMPYRCLRTEALSAPNTLSDAEVGRIVRAAATRVPWLSEALVRSARLFTPEPMTVPDRVLLTNRCDGDGQACRGVVYRRTPKGRPRIEEFRWGPWHLSREAFEDGGLGPTMQAWLDVHFTTSDGEVGHLQWIDRLTLPDLERTSVRDLLMRAPLEVRPVDGVWKTDCPKKSIENNNHGGHHQHDTMDSMILSHKLIMIFSMYDFSDAWPQDGISNHRSAKLNGYSYRFLVGKCWRRRIIKPTGHWRISETSICFGSKGVLIGTYFDGGSGGDFSGRWRFARGNRFLVRDDPSIRRSNWETCALAEESNDGKISIVNCSYAGLWEQDPEMTRATFGGK